MLKDVDKNGKVRFIYYEGQCFLANYDHLEIQEVEGEGYVIDVDENGKLMRAYVYGEWLNVTISGDIILKRINNQTYFFDQTKKLLYDKYCYPLF